MSETPLLKLNSLRLAERRIPKKGPMRVLLNEGNDENLVFSKETATLQRPPSTVRHSCGDMDAGSELASPEIQYVLSEDLKPFDEDVSAFVNTLLERLNSKDWLTVCEALNHARQIAIFHTSSMLHILDSVVASTIKAMKNPRSALCKTGIMATTDFFKAYQDQMFDFLDPLLLQLLLKASQDKRFVCEEAERALDGMTTWMSPDPLLQKLQPYIGHRNPRVRAKASICICKSVSKLGFEGIKNFGLETLMQLAASQLNDQLPEAREAARQLVMDLRAAYQQFSCFGQTHDLQNAQLQQEKWEQFCQRQLSPSTAHAVLRVTCVAT